MELLLTSFIFQELAEEDKRVLEEEDLPDPDPPVEFDSNTVKTKIKEKVMTIRRRPGESLFFRNEKKTSLYSCFL